MWKWEVVAENAGGHQSHFNSHSQLQWINLKLVTNLSRLCFGICLAMFRLTTPLCVFSVSAVQISDTPAASVRSESLLQSVSVPSCSVRSFRPATLWWVTQQLQSSSDKTSAFDQAAFSFRATMESHPDEIRKCQLIFFPWWPRIGLLMSSTVNIY